MKNRPSFEANPWLSHDAGANPSFIRAWKDRIDEDADYEQQISFYKKNYPSVYDLQFLQQNMLCDSGNLFKGTNAKASPF